MLKRSSATPVDSAPGLLALLSHYTDARDLSSGPLPEHPHKKLAVSNLTKNLMSSTPTAQAEHSYGAAAPASQTETPEPSFSRQPPAYSASATPHSHTHTHSQLPSTFAPAAVGLFGLQHSFLHLGASPFHHGHHLAGANPPMPQFTPPASNMNYIPLGHNTPTAVSSSYTSNHSFTPSYSTANAFAAPQQDPQLQAAPAFASSFRAPGGPTTNLSMDSANSHGSFHNPSRLERMRSSVSSASSTFGNYPAGPHGAPSFGGYGQSLPNSFAGGPMHTANSSQQTLPGAIPDTQELLAKPQVHVQPQVATAAQTTNESLFAGPDHYMSYSEYLQTLNERDSQSREGEDGGYEEHLNIVEYPVDDLITMLACLLTKIIEANDKLHPNHFDTTVAARQKLKEQKKIRKMEKEANAKQPRESTSYTRDGINTTVSHIGDDDNSDDSSDDEDDVLKNKYLANVLAFHGTNVPGITLQAYLTRVLKYCPVTNEVFLSLLVYFDRIAKRANNFQNKKSNSADEDSGEPEQIFVMDSFNIHRLIILGITVSSKFFSDIFYKNLRYAKVGGLPLEELNYLELQFLLLLDFKLMISVEDLQNYGDLLLKFWKREQLASEINRDVLGAENASKTS